VGVVSMNECKDFTFPLTNNCLCLLREALHTHGMHWVLATKKTKLENTQLPCSCPMLKVHTTQSFRV
jgi:hypothetical protein